MFSRRAACALLAAALCAAAARAGEIAQEPGTWVKRCPAAGSPSPALGYESALAWDSWRLRLIRTKAHQLSGGWQQAEAWLFDPATMRWSLTQPDLLPPGNCRQQQHVFDPEHGRYFRFTGTSGDHGWQWGREIVLNECSVWAYDPEADRWRPRLPLPEPAVGPQRAADWDSDHGVLVVFGGVRAGDGTCVYDPHANTWQVMEPAGEPANRVGANFAYDPVRGLHVLFGGEGNKPGTPAYDLRANRWVDLGAGEGPPANMPGGNEGLAVYDCVNRAVVGLILVRESGEREPGPAYGSPRHLETWALPSAAGSTWSRLEAAPSDPGGLRCRILAFAPEYNLVFLDNREQKPRGGGGPEHQLWSFRYAAGRAVLPPRKLRVAVSAGAAELSWEPARGGEPPAGWRLWRGTGAEVPWRAEYAPLAELPAGQTRYRDEGLANGQHYFYRVRALDAQGQESAGSATGRAQPPLVEELNAMVVSAGEVRLSWSPPEGAGELAGYLVERAPAQVAATAPLTASGVLGVGEFVRLTETPVAGTSFADTGVDLRQKTNGQALRPRPYNKRPIPNSGPYSLGVYAYRVRAVNALGLTGGPSPYILTIPGPVRGLANRGGAALSWQPVPGAAGYRVYRYDDQSAERANAQPVSECSFTDSAGAGRKLLYFVVAVDALGQEGYPSSPVWNNRPDQELYDRFAAGGPPPPATPAASPSPAAPEESPAPLIRPTPPPAPRTTPRPTARPTARPTPRPTPASTPPPSGASNPQAAELLRKGQECERRGQKIGARSWYSQTIRRFPGTPEAAEARRLLEAMDQRQKAKGG